MDAPSSIPAPQSSDTKFKTFDLHGLKTYELKSRPSKVFHEDLGYPVGPGASVGDWLDSLPRLLAGNDLRSVARSFCRCYEEGRTTVARTRRTRHQTAVRPT